MVTTSRFDENVDLSTTYLGKIDMKREDTMKAEESFPISEQGFCYRKSIKWRGMLDITGYRCE